MKKPGNYFMLGNVALAEGAYRAGANFVAGYPITPATEILEHISRLFLSDFDRNYVQFEDEIGSIGSLIGASWAGAKAMTATSGPGFSLMQENLGLAYMTETPCVIVDVQRSGPSTGQATLPAQGDFYQARYGTHGDYSAIVLAPWSVQEMFDLIITAFNFAEKLRQPVIFLTDGEIGHLEENITIPNLDSIDIVNRKTPDYSKFKHRREVEPFAMTDDLVPPMPSFGDGAELLITGSTHNETGYREPTDKVHQRVVGRINRKVEKHKDELCLYETRFVEDAEDGLVIAYGIAARQAMEAIKLARKKGKKLGLFRLKTVWPFPDEVIQTICKQNTITKIYVVEMSMGKLVREVERSISLNKGGAIKEVIPILKIGGKLHKMKDIVPYFLEEEK